MKPEPVNGVRCLKCGDEIYSTHQHDFKYCKCKQVFVDGGPVYRRRGWSGDELAWIEIFAGGVEKPAKEVYAK